MGFLSDIGGMLPTAYAGFNKGVDDMKARQQRDTDLQYQEEQRNRARSMAPLEDEARASRLKASLKQDKLAGLEGDINQAILKDKQERLPQLLTDAGIKADVTSAGDRIAGAQKLMELGGQALVTGDSNGLNLVFKHLISSGAVQMPDGSPIPTPVRSDVVNAPKGSIDFVGQPIEGRAIQATMPDGSKQYVQTKFMEDAYKRQLQAADAAGAKIIKPGEEWRTPSGRLLAEGKEKVYPGGVVEDANGDFVRIPGVGGAGAGSRSGAGGKAPADAGKQAQDALEFLTKSEEFKALTTSQVASAQLFTERAVAAGVTPREAALIGVEAAKDPAKIKTYVDESGDVQSAYSDPNINGGRPTVLATGVSSLAEVAKTPDGLKSVTAAVTGILDGQVMDTSKAKTPEEQKAVRDQFINAAHNPDDRAALLKAIEGAGPKAVAAMDKRLELIRLYGPKPKTGKPAVGSSDGADKSTSSGKPARSFLDVFGMTPSSGYTLKTDYDRERPNIASVFGVGRPARAARPAQPAQEQKSEPQDEKSPQSLGDDFQSPSARAALARRVRDAASGGRPLSDVERLRAQQLRIL